MKKQLPITPVGHTHEDWYHELALSMQHTLLMAKTVTGFDKEMMPFPELGAEQLMDFLLRIRQDKDPDITSSSYVNKLYSYSDIGKSERKAFEYLRQFCDAGGLSDLSALIEGKSSKDVDELFGSDPKLQEFGSVAELKQRFASYSLFANQNERYSIAGLYASGLRGYIDACIPERFR